MPVWGSAGCRFGDGCRLTAIAERLKTLIASR